MLKKVFLVAAATLLLAGATMTVQSTPAQAKNGCWKAAKAKYPESFKARSTYRRACRKRYRAYRKAHR